ncbi:hypothetical protein LSAT2_025173 [Lamellibrachia satsuma]|nr:hypothetical protein LSAT2_025173 [Lamellibrachia satsuma]
MATRRIDDMTESRLVVRVSVDALRVVPVRTATRVVPDEMFLGFADESPRCLCSVRDELCYLKFTPQMLLAGSIHALCQMSSAAQTMTRAHAHMRDLCRADNSELKVCSDFFWSCSVAWKQDRC